MLAVTEEYLRKHKDNNRLFIEFDVRGSVGFDRKAKRLYHDERINPIGKIKKTGRMHWTPEAQKYVEFKKKIQKAFYEAIEFRNDLNGFERVRVCKNEFEAARYESKAPVIVQDYTKAEMHIFISWAKKNNGDPENVFGTFADALFKQDKWLVGSFDFEYSKTGESSVKVLMIL